MPKNLSWFENNWYIEINFGLYRDYRIVKMADAQGNIRDGIFIPFVQNGIRYIPHSCKPIKQVLKPLNVPRKGNVMQKLIPYVNENLRRKMVDEGVLSPRDKWGFTYVGNVCSDYEFISHVTENERK